MATIPSKQLHRIGTYDELLVNLSDREIGYDPSTKTLYIKDNGELVSCAGNFVELPNAVSLLMGYEAEPGTYAYDWKTLESIEPIPNNPLNLWSRLSGKGFYAEVARMDEKGRNISHMFDVAGIGLVYYGETTYDEVVALSNTYKHIYVDILLDNIHIYMPLVETGETSFTFSSVLSNARYCSTTISEDGWSNVDITSLWPTIDTVVDSESTNPVENRAIADALDLKADKVQGATSGNLASLDGSGNLLDSGKNIADFATSSQGATADTAIQDVKVNGVSLEKDSNNAVDVPVPTGSDSNPSMDGTARAGSSMQWSRGDHVHPTDTSREAVANKDSTIPNNPVSGHYPTTGAVQEFVNSSVATNTATFRGNFTLADLGLTYPATNAQIASSLNSHTWPSGETPTNNDYVYVEIQNPETTGIDDKVERFKYDGSSWAYEYTLNNSSFTPAEKAALESRIDSTKVTEYTAHVNDSSIHVTTSDKEAWDGKQEALPTSGTASDTYVVNISGNAATATSATTASNYASGGGIDTALQGKLGTSGDGSEVSVTPDGSSTGTDIGNSTTLKAWAQKFKNLVGSLKALAFKATVGTSDIANDAITAAKVKDNETLPVSISGNAATASSAASVAWNNVSEKPDFSNTLYREVTSNINVNTAYPVATTPFKFIAIHNSGSSPVYVTAFGGRTLGVGEIGFVGQKNGSWVHRVYFDVELNPSQVGLGNVVNTGDSATPMQDGTEKFTTGGAYTELAKKVDKVSGMGLSTNDFTTPLKDKLDGIDPTKFVEKGTSDYKSVYPAYLNIDGYVNQCDITARKSGNSNYLYNNVTQWDYGNNGDMNTLFVPSDKSKSHLILVHNYNTINVTYYYGAGSYSSITVSPGSSALFRWNSNDAWELIDKLYGFAPTNHASALDTYGVGNASNYGHVKVENSWVANSTNTVQSAFLQTEMDKKANKNGTYADMSVGNSTKWNNRSLVIGSLGTSTSTIYILGA